MSQPGAGLKSSQLAAPSKSDGDRDEAKLKDLLTERTYGPTIRWQDEILTCIFDPRERVSLISQERERFGILNKVPKRSSCLKTK